MDNHLLLLLLAIDEDQIRDRQYVCIQNRQLRNASDPFQLPEQNFKKFFQLSRELAWNLSQILLPHIPNERRTAIPAVLKILTALFFYAHGSYQKCVGSSFLFGLSQPSVSRVIRIISSVMSDHLLNSWVQFPSSAIKKQETKMRFYEKFYFAGIIGCIDCTYVATIAPPAGNNNFPELAYINRKSYHSVNVQLICDADLKITATNARYPGSVHDAAIWSTSIIFQYMQLQYQEGIRSTWLLGDSGYPLQPWLFTPIVGAAPNTPEGRYTRRHTTVRNTVERCIGLLKTRFRCLLRHRTLHYDPVTSGKIIYACAILHNIAIHGNIAEPEQEPLENEEVPVECIREHNWLIKGRAVRQIFIENTFN